MAATRDDIGLLLIHGIGEQKQLDHLRETAREVASLVAESPSVVRLAVRDQTARDNPEIVVEATVRKNGAERQVALHLHEVWWADLGMKAGVLQQVRFWLWGLGQWAAEAIVTGKRSSNSAQMMVLPSFSSRAPDVRPGLFHRLPTHLALFGAALLAFLTFFTWSAAKRLIAFLSKRLPDSSLIFLFIGDVMVYQAAGGPGGGTVEDPDLPVRTTIRRRMLRGMVGMAQRPYQKWLILAHSLGTVPAYNMLQEMELTLPNYLTRKEWDELPDDFKTRQPFVARDAQAATEAMMPRRPPWLSETDGISRAALFERFSGLVTYGCPLDKFAAMWPRIVPLNKQTRVFQPGCEWVNLHDPTDPVAAKLDAFDPPERDPNEPDTKLQALKPQNFACRALLVFLLSHLYYFNPRRPRIRSMAAAVTGALLSDEKLSESAARAVLTPLQSWLRMAIALVQVVLLFVVLLAAGGYLLILIRHALGCEEHVCGLFRVWSFEDLLRNAGIVLIADVVIVAIAGVLRTIHDWLKPHHRR
jgi:hypothetical protein